MTDTQKVVAIQEFLDDAAAVLESGDAPIGSILWIETCQAMQDAQRQIRRIESCPTLTRTTKPKGLERGRRCR